MNRRDELAVEIRAARRQLAADPARAELAQYLSDQAEADHDTLARSEAAGPLLDAVNDAVLELLLRRLRLLLKLGLVPDRIQCLCPDCGYLQCFRRLPDEIDFKPCECESPKQPAAGTEGGAA